MHNMQYAYTYRDFDGAVKSAVCEVQERGGVFNAKNEFGYSKGCDCAVHWKPIRSAIIALMGGREIIEYHEVKV